MEYHIAAELFKVLSHIINNTDKGHKHNSEWNNPDTKEYIWLHSHRVQNQEKKNWYMALELSRAFTFNEKEEEQLEAINFQTW